MILFTLASSAFQPNAAIPKKHTCQGVDVSPPLEWSGAPEGTISFVLIADDPDAPDPADPKMVWVHWVLYDLPGAVTALKEGAGTELPGGTREGRNDWKATGWRGPCPPVGRHRYFFKVYALDAMLGDLGKPTKGQVEAAMKGHVIGTAELIGTYQKE
jgi:Raf kinase inhibitor-like YbhB/YbcL family protein